MLVVLLNCWALPPHEPRVSEPEFHGHQCDGSIHGDADAGSGTTEEFKPENQEIKQRVTYCTIQGTCDVCTTQACSVLLCISDRQNKNFQPRDLFHETITAAGKFFVK